MIDLQNMVGVRIERRDIVKPGNVRRPNKSRFRIDRLADLMRSRGLNQGDLAAHLKISASQVSKWLTGVNTPNIDTLAILADFFGVSADYLLDRIGENQALYNVPELSPDEWVFILSIRDGSFAEALRKLADEMSKKSDKSPEEGPQKP
jgi:transcriptional regulator with XRE-family HTH domain